MVEFGEAPPPEDGLEPGRGAVQIGHRKGHVMQPGQRRWCHRRSKEKDAVVVFWSVWTAPGTGHLIDVIQSSTVTTSACTGKTFSGSTRCTSASASRQPSASTGRRKSQSEACRRGDSTTTLSP